MLERASILPLIVDNLTFEVNGARFLDRISFTLPQGGISIIIGPNGAGKSLTLRLCQGLLTPTSGSVRWHGEDSPRRQKRHAMVFQHPVMLRRSMKANIMHALAAQGHSDTAAKADAALARFGLSHLAERPARLMSGGEQQRLAIARAWALEPDVLFLDEPTSHLDPGATRQIEEIIAMLSAEGMTILMTTHDLGQARRLASRILFLHKGQLVEDAPARDFFDTPASPEAGAFSAGALLW